MALVAQDLNFLLSGASSVGASSTPAASLGGNRSNTEVQEVESTLTSTMTLNDQFIDTTQIAPAPPPEADPRSRDTNVTGYNSAGNLVHWYRMGLATVNADLGDDFIGSNDLNSVGGGLGVGSQSTEQPGTFGNQLKSLTFDGVNDRLSRLSAVTWGMANAWTIDAWVRPTTVAAGINYIWHINPDFGSAETGTFINRIAIQRSGADLRVKIQDSAGTLFKNFTWNSIFAVDTWVLITVTWDGTTLKAYADGVDQGLPDSSPTDTTGTMTDTARFPIIGGRRAAFDPPLDEWTGQIHSLGLWDIALPSSEIGILDEFGDGPFTVLNLTGKWCLMLTGVNATEARFILKHDATTGELFFEKDWPCLSASGDFYRVFNNANLFDNLTQAESANGVTDYRCVYLQNDLGAAIVAGGLWLVPLDPGPVKLEFAAGGTTKNTVPSISVDTTVPDIVTTGGSGFDTTNRQDFGQPRDVTASEDFPSGIANMASAGFFPIWLKRTVPKLTRKNTRSAWLLVVGGTNTGGDPSPIRGGMVIASNVVGFTPVVKVVLNRFATAFGGARVEATVSDVLTGALIEGVDVTFKLTSGTGSLAALGPIKTDAEGLAVTGYLPPNNDADVGTTIVVEAKVNFS